MYVPLFVKHPSLPLIPLLIALDERQPETAAPVEVVPPHRALAKQEMVRNSMQPRFMFSAEKTSTWISAKKKASLSLGRSRGCQFSNFVSMRYMLNTKNLIKKPAKRAAVIKLPFDLSVAVVQHSYLCCTAKKQPAWHFRAAGRMVPLRGVYSTACWRTG